MGKICKFQTTNPLILQVFDVTDRPSLIEEEVFAIRQSGEMPEVALHTAYFYLQEDFEGPRLRLKGEERQRLKDAVEERYLRILMRDLNPRLRDRSVYRGLARAIANWQRLERFCRHEQRDTEAHRRTAAEALVTFLALEVSDVAAGRPPSAVNVTVAELKAFAQTLGLRPADLPPGWRQVCV
jgi:hypothetical protein